jgi:hypothetical protein
MEETDFALKRFCIDTNIGSGLRFPPIFTSEFGKRLIEKTPAVL